LVIDALTADGRENLQAVVGGCGGDVDDAVAQNELQIARDGGHVRGFLFAAVIFPSTRVPVRSVTKIATLESLASAPSVNEP